MCTDPHLLPNLYCVTLSANIKSLSGTNISLSGDSYVRGLLPWWSFVSYGPAQPRWRAGVRAPGPLATRRGESAIGLNTGKGEHCCT